MKLMIIHKIKKVLKDEAKWLSQAKAQLKLFKLQRIIDAIKETAKVSKCQRTIVVPKVMRAVFSALHSVPREEN